MTMYCLISFSVLSVACLAVTWVSKQYPQPSLADAFVTRICRTVSSTHYISLQKEFDPRGQHVGYDPARWQAARVTEETGRVVLHLD